MCLHILPHNHQREINSILAILPLSIICLRVASARFSGKSYVSLRPVIMLEVLSIDIGEQRANIDIGYFYFVLFFSLPRSRSRSNNWNQEHAIRSNGAEAQSLLLLKQREIRYKRDILGPVLFGAVRLLFDFCFVLFFLLSFLIGYFYFLQVSLQLELAIWLVILYPNFFQIWTILLIIT